MPVGVLRHQDQQEGADRDDRDQQPRHVGRHGLEREHPERRGEHRQQSDRHRGSAVGIIGNTAEPYRSDQQL